MNSGFSPLSYRTKTRAIFRSTSAAHPPPWLWEQLLAPLALHRGVCEASTFTVTWRSVSHLQLAELLTLLSKNCVPVNIIDRGILSVFTVTCDVDNQDAFGRRNCCCSQWKGQCSCIVLRNLEFCRYGTTTLGGVLSRDGAQAVAVCVVVRWFAATS